MYWPLSQDYNEVIQSPRSSFSDPELKAGEPVTNALGIPQPRSGNFADVYEFNCPATKTKWALKCFTRQVPGQAQRYAEISRYLEAARLPFGVDFQYQEQGIRVRGQWYPLLKMRWVEGFLLNEFVRDNLDKPNRLKQLATIWGRMAKKLRETGLAHADLQHGNVLLVPGRTASSLAVKLIDYDGMFVPALAGKESGEVGHPNYQHPQRLKDSTYSVEVDRFPLLVVATALQALSVAGPSLWHRYDNGDNLLFKETDLGNPSASRLFAELKQLGDPLTQYLVAHLEWACAVRLEETPLLETLLTEEKPARTRTVRVAETPGMVSIQTTTPGPDWDFEEEGGTFRHQRLGSTKRKNLAGWAWGVGVAVFAMLMIGGILLATRKTPEPKNQESPVAQVQRKDKGAEQLARGGAGAQVPKTNEVPLTLGNDHRVREPNNPEKSNNKPPIISTKRGENRTLGVIKRAIMEMVPHPDNRHLFIADTNEIELWDTHEGKIVRTFSGHKYPILCLDVSADGLRLLTGSIDKTMRLWDVETGKELKQFHGHQVNVVDVAFSPDGRQALSAGSRLFQQNAPPLNDCYVRLWDLDSGRELHRSAAFDTPPGHLAFSEDGRRVFACNSGRDVVVLDRASWREINRITTGIKSSVDAYFPDHSKCIVTRYDEPSLEFWDLDRGIKVNSIALQTKICQITSSPNCRYCVLASFAKEDFSLRLLDLASGQELARNDNPKSAVSRLAFSAKGDRVFWSDDSKSLQVWEIPIEPGSAEVTTKKRPPEKESGQDHQLPVKPNPKPEESGRPRVDVPPDEDPAAKLNKAQIQYQAEIERAKATLIGHCEEYVKLLQARRSTQLVTTVREDIGALKSNGMLLVGRWPYLKKHILEYGRAVGAAQITLASCYDEVIIEYERVRKPDMANRLKAELSRLALASPLISLSAYGSRACVQHANYLGWLQMVKNERDRLSATFELTPGLSDASCVSFRSINVPNHYLVHGDFRVRLQPWEDTEGFRQNGTFRRVKGLASATGISFESVNYPGHYIHARGEALFIDKYDGSLRFRSAATFRIVEPLFPLFPSRVKGFTPLFNGKDTAGWKTHPKQPGNWLVKDGILIGSGSSVSHLYTERSDYRDFHLLVEARINDHGDSGVYFRAPFGAPLRASDPNFPLGYEVQINSTHSDGHKTGSLLVGPDGPRINVRKSPVPPGKWFTIEVLAQGDHITVKVDGKTTADFKDEQGRPTFGHIALQQGGASTVVEFRKIEIKELSAEPEAKPR